MPIKIRVRPIDEPQLRPAREFPGDLASRSLFPDAEKTGRNAQTVGSRIARSTAGWKVPPSTEEFHQAIHAARPTERQRAIIGMWAQEADPREMLMAWVQRAYSWRTLVRALHWQGFTRRGELNAYLNWFAS